MYAVSLPRNQLLAMSSTEGGRILAYTEPWQGYHDVFLSHTCTFFTISCVRRNASANIGSICVETRCMLITV